MKSMQVMKVVFWALGTSWIAFFVACVRGLEFGFQWELFPLMLGVALVLGSPAVIVIYVTTKGGICRRFKFCSAFLALGVFLGLSYVGVEDYLFCRKAASMGLPEFVQERSWPLDSYTLYYTDGTCWVMD